MQYVLRFYLLNLAMLASAVALTIALIAQYGFQFEPCELCSYQRIPYATILLLGGGALAIGEWNKRAVGYLFATIFLTGAALAFYHVGVEQFWWQAVTSCGGHQPLPNSLEELHISLSRGMEKTCEEIDWTLLGLSMTVYNAAASLLLAIVCYFGARLTH